MLNPTLFQGECNEFASASRLHREVRVSAIKTGLGEGFFFGGGGPSRSQPTNSGARLIFQASGF